MKLKRVLYFAVDRRVLFVPVVFSVWILLRRGMWDNPNLPWAMVISFLVPFAESVWNRHALPPGFRVLYKLSLFALFAGCVLYAGCIGWTRLCCGCFPICFSCWPLCTARRAKRLLCALGCALLPPAGLTAPCLSSDAFGCFFLLLAAPYFFFAVRNDAVFPDKAAGAARGGFGGGCERAAGLSEIPAPRRRVHRFRRGVGCGAAAYVFAAACIRRRTALDFMSGRVRLRTVRRRGAARRRTMI